MLLQRWLESTRSRFLPCVASHHISWGPTISVRDAGALVLTRRRWRRRRTGVGDVAVPRRDQLVVALVVEPAARDHVEPRTGDAHDREGAVAVVVAFSDLGLGVVDLEDAQPLPGVHVERVVRVAGEDRRDVEAAERV